MVIRFQFHMWNNSYERQTIHISLNKLITEYQRFSNKTIASVSESLLILHHGFFAEVAKFSVVRKGGGDARDWRSGNRLGECSTVED
jgi:hypothetical protein